MSGGERMHDRLLAVCPRLPSDYSDHGGQVERWASDDESYPDCSCGCRWALWLPDALGADWCVCTKPGAPRAGLLTFEHMAGKGCFEPAENPSGAADLADPDTVEELGDIAGDGGEAVVADAMRAAFIQWLAREARGALGVFRPEAVAARTGCDLTALCGAFTRLRLAERHGFSGLWRLTPAGLAAVDAVRGAEAGHTEAADDAPEIVATPRAISPARRGEQRDHARGGATISGEGA